MGGLWMSFSTYLSKCGKTLANAADSNKRIECNVPDYLAGTINIIGFQNTVTNRYKEKYSDFIYCRYSTYLPFAKNGKYF